MQDSFHNFLLLHGLQDFCCYRTTIVISLRIIANTRNKIEKKGLIILGKLLIYLRDYKKESILGPLFKLLEASFELIVPLVMAAIIDTGIANQDKGYVFQYGIILILLGLIGLICSITAQYFAAKAAVGFSTKLRHALFTHIEGLSFQEIDTVGTSTLITRMTSDINQVQSGVNLTLRLFLRSPFIVFGAMIMAFTIDFKAALIFVVTIPLLSIVVFTVMLVSIPIYKKVQSCLDHVLLLTRENLTGARVIRAFHKEEEEYKRFLDKNGQLTSLQMFVGSITALTNPITYVIINGAIILLIYTGAIQVNIGNLTQGQVVALVNYMSQILVELIKLANLIVSMTKAFACANRVQSIFEIECSIKEKSKKGIEDASLQNNFSSTKTIVPAIEFQKVYLMYQNAGEEALTDLNFTVNKGQTIGIIGGTGSGKSSLVHLIARYYDVSKGQVLINGKDVRDYPLDMLRRKVGIVMQKAVLFQGSLRDNLKWGKEDATEEEMWHVLELSQAKEFVLTKEGGLDFIISQGGKNLSGGQKQRLTIARALIRKPEILILDDSASALDFATDAKLRAAIKTIGKEMTVFIVSQRASSIQYADQILVLDDGQIVGKGKHEELLENCRVYQEIYYSQFPKQATSS